MKRILGLDLGSSSIGWALVNEAESKNERSSIVKLGVRVNPLTVDESINFGRVLQPMQIEHLREVCVAICIVTNFAGRL